MSNAAIITLARSVSNSLSRLWWPLRAGRIGQVARLLWDLADRLERAGDVSAAHISAVQQIGSLQARYAVQEQAITRLTGELTAERERCARLILQQRKVKK